MPRKKITDPERRTHHVERTAEANSGLQYSRLARLEAFYRMQSEAAVRLREFRDRQDPKESRFDATVDKGGITQAI
jgi:hypothetical protein